MTTSKIITSPKTTGKVTLKPGVYVKVAETGCPEGAGQHAMLYGNFKLKIRKGYETGRIRVKARRRGTTDDTAYHDVTVHVDDDYGNAPWLLTSLWFGGRPPEGWLDWYVRLDRNVVSGVANNNGTDYGKGMNN